MRGRNCTMTQVKKYCKIVAIIEVEDIEGTISIFMPNSGSIYQRGFCAMFVISSSPITCKTCPQYANE